MKEEQARDPLIIMVEKTNETTVSFYVPGKGTRLLRVEKSFLVHVLGNVDFEWKKNQLFQAQVIEQTDGRLKILNLQLLANDIGKEAGGGT